MSGVNTLNPCEESPHGSYRIHDVAPGKPSSRLHPSECRWAGRLAVRLPGKGRTAGGFHVQSLPLRDSSEVPFGAVREGLHGEGLAIVGISSNDVAEYPQDGPEQMKAEHASAGYVFPYLHDSTQSVAKAYRAACTPDFFLFDDSQRLVYRGQFDDSRPKTNLPITGADLRAACDALLAGLPVVADQKPSIGCNIKWAAGSEPDYFTGVSA